MATLEQKLQKEFNRYWQKVLRIDDDLFSRLSLSDFLNLKKSISNVNNIVTLKTTKKFVDFLYDEQIINSEQRNAILFGIEHTSANANGYDVDFQKDIKIIAEIKCNIPVGKSSFGAKQEEGIRNDIDHLFRGKSKSSIATGNIKDCYKFMVMLNQENVKPCMQKVINKYNADPKNSQYYVEEYCGKVTLSTNKVYIVYVNF